MHLKKKSKGNYIKEKNISNLYNGINAVVAGVEQGVGTTHFSILLGNYFAAVYNKKVAVVSLSHNSDFINMCEVYEGCEKEKLLKEEYIEFRIGNILFFTTYSKHNIEKIFQRVKKININYIVYDVGTNYFLYRNNLIMCNQKYLIGSVSLWKIAQYSYFLNLLKENEENNLWKYLYTHGEKQNAKNFSESNNIILNKIPYSENPFKVSGECIEKLEKIIWEM